MKKRVLGGCLATVALLLVVRISTADTEPLPEPLTLEHALSLAERGPTDVAQARADLEYSQAEERLAQSRTGVNVALEGRLRWVEPSEVAADQSNGDHRGSLFVRKNLYDFGRSAAEESAAEGLGKASRLRYTDVVRQRRIAIMEAYFDVLLADLEFARDNEEMAVVYVSLDRLQDRHELGQVSDIDLLEMEAEYQAIRKKRAASQARQRSARSRLAIALGRPGELSSDLSLPDLPQLDGELPEYESLLKKALAENPAIRALRAEVKAAESRIAGARAGRRPYLDGELEASTYSREAGSHDDWRAGVVLTVPLYSGGAVGAQIAREKATLNRTRASLAAAEDAVRQALLDNYLDLETLQVDADRVLALQDYRDLYLDRSRTIYELEVKTDLGDAMVRLSEAQIEAAKNRFGRVLAWERLKALAGGLPKASTSADEG
ncbi:TolC family protein [Thiohalomonas denitrificans]|uniref:Outer membrane protein TolC n=1 Tax=Thiohalomonas denitrificans TaxID=415747 RepID=A0A1G5QMA6_9GAMM|nr:TolC family protein [Thiohalomonas denitrificans]SCZ62867.1 Outer membrane protein TolC [Thiohalomonas denitrificans]